MGTSSVSYALRVLLALPTLARGLDGAARRWRWLTTSLFDPTGPSDTICAARARNGERSTRATLGASLSDGKLPHSTIRQQLGRLVGHEMFKASLMRWIPCDRRNASDDCASSVPGSGMSSMTRPACRWLGTPMVVVGYDPRPIAPDFLNSLGNNIWSFAGDSDRDNVNLMTVQPFVNYNFEKGWYVSSGRSSPPTGRRTAATTPGRCRWAAASAASSGSASCRSTSARRRSTTGQARR